MIIHGDCLDKLKTLDDNSIDSIVTDPPYGWRFMGKSWDYDDIVAKAKASRRPGETFVGKDGVTRKTREDASMAAGKYDQSLKGNLAFMEWTCEWAKEALRVLKPGGHVIIFCGPRTYHAMAMGVEMAGFEIRDQLQWLFGSGFPKSHNLKDEHQGWGTALKPANEPICLARKPLVGTVAKNVQEFGTGAINIAASRISTEENLGRAVYQTQSWKNTSTAGVGSQNDDWKQGRWPANVLFDEEAAAALDEQSGQSKSVVRRPTGGVRGHHHGQDRKLKDVTVRGLSDSGGASRFFYVAKASKSERSGGNNHPTVKPIKLMEYLVRMITPPNGVCLDPFMGSGSTGVAAKNLGFKFIGIEREADYINIATKRIEAVNG